MESLLEIAGMESWPEIAARMENWLEIAGIKSWTEIAGIESCLGIAGWRVGWK